MQRLFVVGIFLGFLAMPATGQAAFPAVCRGLLSEDRIGCLNDVRTPDLRKRFDLPRSSRALSGVEGSFSSSSPLPLSFPHPLRNLEQLDPSYVPEGMSCVRMRDMRRANCQLQRLLERTSEKNAGHAAASSSSVVPWASAGRPHCLRLPGSEQRECLVNLRSGIGAATRTVK